MNKTKKSKTLFVTRALCAPWDEASKNLAHDLSKHITSVDLTVLTHGHVADIPTSVHQSSIYSSAPPSTFSLRQKVESLWHQWRHRHDFDIVHYFFTPAKLNSFFVKKFFINSHTKTVQTVATLRKDILSLKDFKDVLFADELVTYTKDAYDDLIGMGFNNVTHIYPGIDTDKFYPDEKDSSLLEKFNIPIDTTVIMYPGEYIRLGSTDMIVDVMIDLWDKNASNNSILLLALRVKNDVDAQKKKSIQKKIAKAGYTDSVVYTDTFSDMPKLYNLSDIVLFPVSNMKGKFDVPLALIEAYACSKPTIVSNISRLSEFTDSETNVIIEKGNARALSTAIMTLCDDTQKQKQIGDSARDFVIKNFNIKKSTTQYEQLYRKIQK